VLTNSHANLYEEKKFSQFSSLRQSPEIPNGRFTYLLKTSPPLPREGNISQCSSRGTMMKKEGRRKRGNTKENKKKYQGENAGYK
jgi:hypothetical protein